MIPLIFGALAVGTAAYGALSSINGVSDLSAAKDIVETAKASYQEAYARYTSKIQEIEEIEEQFKQFKIDTIGKFIHRYNDIQARYISLYSSEDASLLEQMNDTIAEKIRKYNVGEISAEECFEDLKFAYDKTGS